jgi:5-methyltetrahydropteroyltriglutamate--homocysteine methyltransferase
MKISSDRILVSHVGSLPRPPALAALLKAENDGEPFDAADMERQVSEAVDSVVAEQVANGVDVVSDGEMSKIAYTFYVRHRLSGIGDPPEGDEMPEDLINTDLLDHPDFHAASRAGRTRWVSLFSRPWCLGPVEYVNREPLERDLAHLKSAVEKAQPQEAFMNAASPGLLPKFVPNGYYDSEDAYVEALTGALQPEYEAIVNAGFVLQLDCPDLGSARHSQYQKLSDAEFLKIADRNIEAINHATRNIPPDMMRLHICWGNYNGPHTHDIELYKLWPALMKARPAAILFEGANPRHAHEWEDVEHMPIPEDKIVIPGVVDSTSNFVEHPTLIAQRLCHWADIVGRERVIAGTDCGFGTFAIRDHNVAPSVVWAKFRAMAEGAAIATDRLWGRRKAS